MELRPRQAKLVVWSTILLAGLMLAAAQAARADITAVPAVVRCTTTSPAPFAVSVTEAFPAALTTTAQEAAFSNTPPPTSGTTLEVILTDVPSGVTVTPVGTQGSTGTLVFAPLPVAVTQPAATPGATITFSFAFIGTDLGAVETAVLNFTIGYTELILADKLSQVITARVRLGPVASIGIVRFVDNTVATGDVATVILCKNPATDVGSLSPSGATAGGDGFTLTVNGSGFISTSAVRWDGEDRPTTFVSSNQVQGEISATDIVAPRTVPVRVFNPAPGGGVSPALPFTITTAGAPAFTAASITNGASFVPGVTPGAIVTIFGTGLTTDVSGVVLAEQLPLPTELRGTSVTLSGIAAPLFAVADVDGQEQINLQVPYELTGPVTATVVVNNNGVLSDPVEVNLSLAQPGIFTLDGTAGVILHAATFEPVTASKPAVPGEAVLVYATGLGPVSPAPLTGAPASASPLSLTSIPPLVTVGGVVAEVLFSGLAPDFVGLYQVNIAVPQDAPSGDVDVLVQTDGQGEQLRQNGRPVRGN